MTDRFSDEGRDDAGRIKPGYALWRLRKVHGRSPLYEDAEQLWTACCGYFEETFNSPLYEEKAFSSGGEVILASVTKMRAFTIKGLSVYLRISLETWRDWRLNRDDLKAVIETVEAIIYTQKFEGAAAGLLNSNIIARDLGLAEKSEVTGKGGGPIRSEEVSMIEAARRLAFILERGAHLSAENASREAKTSQNEGSLK